MTFQAILVTLLVVAGGMALAVQPPVNSALSRAIGGTVPAVAVSFAVGFVTLAAVAFVTGQGSAFGRLPLAQWWMLGGGCLGAFYVLTSVWGVQTLGVVTLFAALIFGQMVAALAIDATGAFGATVHAISPQRIIAAGLVMAGLVLSRL